MMSLSHIINRRTAKPNNNWDSKETAHEETLGMMGILGHRQPTQSRPQRQEQQRERQEQQQQQQGQRRAQHHGRRSSLLALVCGITATALQMVLLCGSVHGSSRLIAPAEAFTPHHVAFRRQHALNQGEDPWSSTKATLRRTSPSSLASVPQPSIPCNDGAIAVARSDDVTFDLPYKVFRPMSLSSRKAAPIVLLCDGDASLDDLMPFLQAIPYRCIVVCNGLGGDAVDDNAVSIALALEDLQRVLNKAGVRRYHLYGQGVVGGILAFEYLKQIAQQDDDDVYDDGDDEGCLSVILSSTPTNVQKMREEGILSAAATASWKTSDDVSSYVASPPSESAKRMPSCMIVRGEDGIVTQGSIEGWKALFCKSRSVREKVLVGDGHHGLVTNPLVYGDCVDTFFGEYD